MEEIAEMTGPRQPPGGTGLLRSEDQRQTGWSRLRRLPVTRRAACSSGCWAWSRLIRVRSWGSRRMSMREGCRGRSSEAGSTASSPGSLQLARPPGQPSISGPQTPSIRQAAPAGMISGDQDSTQEERRPQAMMAGSTRRTAYPPTAPAPKPGANTRIGRSRTPSRAASWSAIGMLAEDVLPTRSMSK